MRANRVKWVAAAAVAGLVATAAIAETATMTGRFPAPYREAAMLGSLSVGRIDGRDGYQVGSAIERALASTGYFNLQGGRRSGGNADGMLSGGVSSGVEDSYYRRKEKRCVERDANKKCIREQEFEIRCTQRVANLTVDVRIVRYDGQIVYSANKPLRQQIDWCEGQSAPRTAEEMISAMANEVAASVRNDIVPRTDTYRIRFRESTKDLPKPEVKPFKDLIRLTQRDLRSACAGFTAMNGRAPNHASILFNLGLCAEAAGDLRGALAWYQRAQPLLGRRSEAEEGIGRMQSRMAADADDAERARRLR
ncbi:tetratricopeptide repeat protein [Sphingomonas sp. LB-2]|uniref:tetratricopeptide repeat protein n=1 Tax=Sphingomonas caeni TaxID=2984949 RepID=UPI00222E3E22|nr:tetratricopeptide repeat protein [Sphingomonas caeni]MCW3846092.1 tetratricopeptide repeat protein [Sphingomonas caeni]